MTDQQLEYRLKLLKDSGWRAALTIFTGKLLRDRGEVWSHIDLESATIDIETMLYDCGPLSGGEKRMVKLALSLFTMGQDVNLWSILAGLDEENSALAVDAVANFHAAVCIEHQTEIEDVMLSKPVRERELR